MRQSLAHHALLTLGLLTLALVSSADVRAAEPIVDECNGCHGPTRAQPKARFKNGLGQWSDLQCHGCHAELNDVARRHAERERDPRYWAVPVSETRLTRMAREPLSYTSAGVRSFRD